MVQLSVRLYGVDEVKAQVKSRPWWHFTMAVKLAQRADDKRRSPSKGDAHGCELNKCRSFWFVHVPKSGGSSVTASWGGALPGRAPNFSEARFPHAAMRLAQLQGHPSRCHATCRAGHATAQEMRKNSFGPAAWDELETFAIVRNPFTWVLSYFFFIASKCLGQSQSAMPPSTLLVCPLSRLLTLDASSPANRSSQIYERRACVPHRPMMHASRVGTTKGTSPPSNYIELRACN